MVGVLFLLVACQQVCPVETTLARRALELRLPMTQLVTPGRRAHQYARLEPDTDSEAGKLTSDAPLG